MLLNRLASLRGSTRRELIYAKNLPRNLPASYFWGICRRSAAADEAK